MNKLGEKKQTILNLIAKIISYGSTLLISFFLTPFLVEKIGKEAYSFYPLANNFVSYMSIITIALNSMASRFITIALANDDKEKANTYFVSILTANTLLAAILLIPMTVIIVFLEYILNIPVYLIPSIKILFSLVFISMIVNLLTNVFGVAVFSKNRLELSSISDIIIGAIRAILYILLFLFFTPNIIYVGIVSLVVACITVVFQIVFTKKLLPDMQIRKKYVNFGAIKEVLSSGIWNSINQIGIVLLSTVGLLLCNKLYGASAGGDYSIALTIPQFMNGIVSMLCSVFLPMLTIKYARGNQQEILEHINETQNVVGLISNIPIAVFMAVGLNFFNLWTPSVDSYRLWILSIFAIGYLLVTSVSWPVSNLNTVMNRVKVPALVMLGTGVINIVLILLTYKFTNLGLYSIPLVELILYIINRTCFVCIYTARCLKEKWYIFLIAIIKNLLGASVLFVIAYFVNRLVDPQTWFSLIIECIILGGIGLLINSLIIFKPSGIKKGLEKVREKAMKTKK